MIAREFAVDERCCVAEVLEVAMLPRRTTTKADIIETVYARVGGFSKTETAEMVGVVFDTVKETLERGETIKISGFGNFARRATRRRASGGTRRPRREITIAARRVIKFKPSQVLRSAINEE